MRSFLIVCVLVSSVTASSKIQSEQELENFHTCYKSCGKQFDYNYKQCVRGCYSAFTDYEVQWDGYSSCADGCEAKFENDRNHDNYHSCLRYCYYNCFRGCDNNDGNNKEVQSDQQLAKSSFLGTGFAVFAAVGFIVLAVVKKQKKSSTQCEADSELSNKFI